MARSVSSRSVARNAGVESSVPDQRARGPALEPDLDVVDDRQVAEQPDVLERPGDPEPGHPVGRRAGDVGALEPDRSRVTAAGTRTGR